MVQRLPLAVGPHAKGGLHRFSLSPTGFDSGEGLSAYTSGVTVTAEQIRLMVQTAPQHWWSPWGRAVVQPVKLGTCKWSRTLVAVKEKSPSMLQ